jgi:3-phenylpropionate/cinnamic acid dioxygenase small subunit
MVVLRTLVRLSTFVGFVAAFLAAPLVLAADLDELAARVQQLEDREEIRELLLAYGRALDSRDFIAFSELFAEEEGEWIGGLGAAKGRQAIFDLMDKSIGHNRPRTGPPSYHVFSNEQITVDGDSASATTKWIFVMQNDETSPRWVYLGHYDDTFVRESGRWRFLKRQAFTDIPAQE